MADLSAQHAAHANAVYINAGISVIAGANSLYPEDKRRLPRYATKDEPLVTE